MSLTVKWVDYILKEPLNLDVIVGQIFFTLPLWIPEENKVKLKKLFNLNRG